MNILVTSDMYFPTLGGICVATDQLIRQLAKRGHKVSLIAPAVSSKSVIETISHHITVYRIASVVIIEKKGIRFAYDIKAINKAIQSEAPDIIHIMTPGPGLIGPTVLRTAKAKKIPVVATSHIIKENIVAPLHHLPGFVEESIGDIAMISLKSFYQQVDHMISPSGAGADHLQKLGITVPITVISNGIFIEKFSHPDMNILHRMKDRLALPEKPVILYTGRLDKEKGVDVLFKAFIAVHQTLDVQLLLVGNGVEMDRMKAYCIQHQIEKSVTFAGFLTDDEIPAVYHLSDVFVMPSCAELQSISTMEAMSVNLPVIGANAMALPYLIHDNDNGFLFKPGDSEDLAKKLRIILTDQGLRTRMGQRSFFYVQEHAMEQVVLKFEHVYQSVITKSHLDK